MAPTFRPASASASSRIWARFCSASFTRSSAIRWAAIRAFRMASSVERYSSTFSTSTFILLFKTAFSLYRAL